LATPSPHWIVPGAGQYRRKRLCFGGQHLLRRLPPAGQRRLDRADIPAGIKRLARKEYCATIRLFQPRLRFTYFGGGIGIGAACEWVGIAFAVTALLALPFNIRKGFAWRDGYVIGMSAFEQDLSNGLSWQELGDKHEPFFARGDGPILVERMRMLHEAKIGPLGRAAPP
jgi:hypothetical protein